MSIYYSRWFGKAFHSYSDSQYSRGVSILFRKNLPIDVINVHTSIGGRRLLINFKYDEKDFTIVNVYAPNNTKDRIDFFKRVKTWTNQLTCNKENILIAGDFNCILDNSTNNSDKSCHVLKNVLNDLDLIDLWSTLKREPGYTWCDGTNTPKSRIDYIFISSSFSYIVSNIMLRNIPGTHSINGVRMSDHKCMKVVFDTCSNIRGPGYWKFNTSLLEKEDFINEMKEHITNIEFTETENDPHEKWEYVKSSIKTFCMNFSAKLNKTIKSKILDIENEISQMENVLHTDTNMNRKRHLECELNRLIDNKAKGAQIRSRANWIEQGETNSSYFLRLELQRQTYNTIKSLKREDDSVVTGNDNIIGTMCDFYKTLYTSNNIDTDSIDEYMSRVNFEQKLSDDENMFLESFPTINECRDAVFNMKVNKSPGSDGLPSEFYKIFWNEISLYYYNSLIHSYAEKSLSPSQKLSILTILHKKGDRQLLNNYRPLSLTNTDYKIIAFVLARRLQKIVNRVISNDQSAYIKGRFIGINARTIVDIFEYCEQNDIDGILLFLDFQKAFDSVEWNFMFKVLKEFNFGDAFIEWLQLLYTNPVYRLKNNGWL